VNDLAELTLGFSSCPNDTFIFDAMVHGRVDTGARFRVVMEDVEALNRRALAGRDGLAVTKLSMAAAGRVLERYALLRSGAALGRGCGPLVVVPARSGVTGLADLRGRTVAIPGEGTTAALLLRMFAPEAVTLVPARFDENMPAVVAGTCDAGVIIHESRFTFPAFGLRAVADLGQCWESDTGLPLPLGVIAASRALHAASVERIEAAIRASVRHAWNHPEDCADYVRVHAQEMDPEVCERHIALYVNAFSDDIGEQGSRAVELLFARGRSLGVLPAFSGPIWATSPL
jgi:1,4-dihydroxy-6-naphthoate synthase